MPKFAPQEIRTFFVTAVTFRRQSLLQSDRMATLFIDVLKENHSKKRFQLHEYVAMPNHFHLVLTPSPENPLEKCLQFIKGGFSFRAKKELNFAGEVWQPTFTLHRIETLADYNHHAAYTRNNPVRAGLAKEAEDFAYSSAHPSFPLDPAPQRFQG
jgi:putative transposase